MPASSQEFLDIQATIECGLTLKCVHDMIRTYSQMHDTDEYSKHSSIICSVWLNGWVFDYELSGCGFESSCSHLNFRFGTCFKQGVPWHSGNYRVWIHSEMRLWHDKYIQSNNNILALTLIELSLNWYGHLETFDFVTVMLILYVKTRPDSTRPQLFISNWIFSRLW